MMKGQMLRMIHHHSCTVNSGQQVLLAFYILSHSSDSREMLLT